MSRKVTFKPNKLVHPCPKCGNNTVFTVYSQQVSEYCCDIWIVCKCGFDPTEEDTGNRLEDVWGGTHDDNVYNAVNLVWNDLVPALTTID